MHIALYLPFHTDLKTRANHFLSREKPKPEFDEILSDFKIKSALKSCVIAVTTKVC